VQSGPAVVVLALEAQGLQAWGVLRHGPSPGDLDGVPPGLVDGFSDSFSFAVGQFPGGCRGGRCGSSLDHRPGCVQRG